MPQVCVGRLEMFVALTYSSFTCVKSKSHSKKSEWKEIQSLAIKGRTKAIQTSLDFRQFHFGCLIIFQALYKSLRNKLSGCRPFNNVVYASHFTRTHILFIRFPSSISSAIFSSLCLFAARSRQRVHTTNFSINMAPFTSTESYSQSQEAEGVGGGVGGVTSWMTAAHIAHSSVQQF